MKKCLLACLLALPLSALSPQEASAGCCFNFSGSFDLSYTSTGHTWCFSCYSNPCPCCWGGCDSGSYAAPCYDYGTAYWDAGGYGSYQAPSYWDGR